MVIIKKENCKPLLWKIGRVTEITHDDKGRARVVTLKVAKSDASQAMAKKGKTVDPEKIQTKIKFITRSIHQVCPLPNNEEEKPQQVKQQIQKPIRTILNAEATEFEPVAKRTRSRGTKANIMMAVMALLFTIFGISAKECNYSAFDHSPGLFFENGA